MTEKFGNHAARGAAITGGAQIVKIILTTVTTIVASRLLTPDDYGVIAMAAPVMAFILLFQDLGLSQATIQAKSITDSDNTALFWINVGVSFVCAVIIVILSPLVAAFYRDPRAGYVAAASAVTIVVTGASLQHVALLNRSMRFGALAVIDIARTFATFIVTVGAALLIGTYWAVWLGALAGAVVGTGMYWVASGWKPSGQPSFGRVREQAAFGGHLTGYNLLNFVVRNADNILIARTSSASDLGLYDRSYRLMMLPLQNINGPLGRVMLPVLSRLRDDAEGYRRAYLTSVRAMLVLAFPGMAVAAMTSDELIPFLLGNQWSSAGPIFFWLSLTGLIQLIANTTGWLYVTSGRVRQQLHWGVFSAAVTLLGFVVGIKWGATGVAASLFVTAVGRLPLLYHFSVRGTSVSARDLYRVAAEPSAGAIVAFCVVLAVRPYVATGSLLCTAIVVAYGTTLMASVATRSGRSFLRSVTMPIKQWISKPENRGSEA